MTGSVDTITDESASPSQSCAQRRLPNARADRVPRAIYLVLATTSFLTCLPVATAHGQVVGTGVERAARDPDSFLNQQRQVDERLRRAFEREVGDDIRSVFDWGGWFNMHLFLSDDGLNSSRTLRRYDLRLWGRLRLDDGAQEFYVRTRTTLLDFNSGDAFDRNGDDVEEPTLERGIYRIDLARVLSSRGERPVGYSLSIAAGRDLIEFGQGLALATPLDHVAVHAAYRHIEVTALAGKTVGSSVDPDRSRTATRTRRNFLGAEFRYTGFERHRPFAYALWQRDRNSEARFAPFQRFNYDSSYFGVGSSGEMGRGWRYSTEWVLERGTSWGHRQFLHRNDIAAWAWDAQFEYLFPGPHKSRASFEYLFGSGDGDRFGSPTDSVGGNLGDRTDTSFVGFGYRDTGLAFAPRYSNLHMWRTGASYYPLPKDRRFGDLELGTNWFLFYKNHRDGAVSDSTANRRSGYLGWEMDYFANWRVTSDLAWTARLGVFFPGAAFDDRTTRTFLLFGVTYSF